MGDRNGARHRVLHLASVINRDDFIDVIVRSADRERFAMSACTFVGPSTIRDPAYAEVGIPHHRLARPRGFGNSAFVSLSWSAIRLAKILRALRVEILHSHHFDGALLGWAATRIARHGCLVIGRHYSDAIYQLATGLRRRGYLTLEGRSNLAARAIVVPSLAAERVLLSQGVDPSKVVRIPYAFDFQSLSRPALGDLRAASGAWGDEPGSRLITCGRLHREKGHRYLFAALSRLRNQNIAFRLLVVGDGPERLALERQAQELGLAEDVRFLGWRTDARELIAASDLVVQPTLHEAFSQVMVEAMALERALVISDVSGVNDIVEDGISGWIVPPREVAALADAIRQGMDRARATEVGRHARTRVTELLDRRTVVPRFEALYVALLGTGALAHGTSA